MPLGKVVERTTKRRISLGELKEYTKGIATVAEDVISNGTVLLPRGTELASLMSSVENLENTLRRWGIFSIPITLSNKLDVNDLEHMLKTAEANLSVIDPQLARETVTQVSNVYGRITDGVCKPEDISHLAEQGRNLAKEVAQATQVMFCLGQVRSWDEYTYVHSLNVALLGGFLASRLFPGRVELMESMSMGGILHDLGKARVPQEILNKPGRLAPEEFDIMKKHAIYGAELATENSVTDEHVLAVVRGHHERFMGGGYPDGLMKDNIPIEARIAAVADVFDALTAQRVYKPPIETRSAISIMLENMDGHFDPQVVRILLTSLGLYPPGTMVELSDGSIGIAVGARGNDLLRPEVLLQIDRTGRRVSGDMRIIDLSMTEGLFVERTLHSTGKFAF